MILLQRRAAQAQQIARRAATDSAPPPPSHGQQGRREPDQEIEAPPPPPPLPVHQVAHDQRINGRPATNTMRWPPSGSPVSQVAQSQQIRQHSATRHAASPSHPPQAVQRAVQGHGATQSNTQANEDSDDNETPPSPSTDSRRLPPRFLARSGSRVIVDSPRSDRQPSPPLDTENVDKRRGQRITKSTPRDPPSHQPCACAKKLTLRVPPRRKQATS